MTMNYLRFIFAVVAALVLLNGCELFDISKTSYVTYQDLTQETPTGVVYLFMAELDSNNAKGASVLLLPEGHEPVALERVNKYPELERLHRVLCFDTITAVSLDTISREKVKVSLEVNYFKYYTFITQEKDSLWFIGNYEYRN